jgi:hypothetical protein
MEGNSPLASHDGTRRASDFPLIGDAYRAGWEHDSKHWRGKVMTGLYAHWCSDWDDLPIDETCPEWPCACSDELIATIEARFAAGTLERRDPEPAWDEDGSPQARATPTQKGAD